MPTEAAKRHFKDSVYGELARIGRAVASPKRLELLELLAQRPWTVEDLAAQAHLTVGNASQHLQVLRAARLVEAEKQGLYVVYRLAGDDVGRFFVGLRELAHARLAEAEQVKRQYLADRSALEAVPGEELLRRVRSGRVTVLDVRPSEEYESGHIPGAASIPVGELKKRLRELPKNREVVAYCRGPYCVMAIEAVEVLQRHGYRATRMEQGVLEWRSRGWRIEATRKRPSKSIQ